MAGNPRYWKLIAHHSDRGGALQAILSNRRIAVGWGYIGDLRASPPSEAKDIRDRIRLADPQAKNSHLGGIALWRLFSQMKVGDRVFVGGPNGRMPLFEITGPYEWFGESESFGDYQHCRSVRLLDEGAAKLWYARKFRLVQGEHPRGTVVQVQPTPVHRDVLPRFGTIRCWCEVTGRPDIGGDLKCPAVNEAGDEYWSYSLIHEVMPGDLVFHYSTVKTAFVGVSVAGGPIEARDIVWAARGTSSRAENREPSSRDGWWRPLYSHTELPQPLPLDELAQEENVQWLSSWVEQHQISQPLMIPFQIRGDGLRAGQGYLFKLPWEIIERYSVLDRAAQTITEASEDVVLQATSEGSAAGISPSGAEAPKLKSAEDYVAFIAARQQIRTRTHEAIVNGAVGWLQGRGYSVKTPHPIDLLTEGNPAVIYEAKVVRGGTALFAIREAVGQLLEYRHFIGPKGAQLCILLNAQPPDHEIAYVEKDLNIAVAWFLEGRMNGGKKWRTLSYAIDPQAEGHSET